MISFAPQWSSTLLSDCEKISCHTQYYHSEIPFLFFWHSTRRFSPISTAENGIERPSFCGFRWGDQNCDEATKQPIRK